MSTEYREPSPLFGLAIGDAVGREFNGLGNESEEITRWNGILTPVSATSITKLVMSLARCLMEDYTYNPATVISSYVNLYKESGLADIEATVTQALDRILWGYHWNASGIEHATGCAPALRAAPIGHYFRSDLITVMDMTRFDTRLTHKSVEAEESAIALALGVALLSEGTPKEDVLKPILNLLGESKVRTRLELLPNTLSSMVPYLLPKSESDAMVVTAFACFLSTDNFEDAVEKAVRLGGRCSMTASLTGALAGAHYGIQEGVYDNLDCGPEIRHLEHILHVSAPKIEHLEV